MIINYYKTISNFLGKIADNRILQIALFIILFITLEFEYYHFINIPLFKERQGFDFDFSWGRYFLSKLFFLFSLYLVYKTQKFDFLISSLFLIFLSIPSFIFYEFMPNTPVSISLFLVLFHVLFFLSTKINYQFNTSIVSIKENKRIWILFIVTLAFLIPFFMGFGLEINLKAFSLSDIYEVRESGSKQLTFITAYLYGWIVRIIIPIGLIMSFKEKKWLMAFAFIIIQLYMYSLIAQKIVFFTLFFTFVMIVKSHKRQISVILFTILMLIFISMAFSAITNNIMPESIIVRRTFFIPTIITKDYFEFFNGKSIYYSHSFLRSFIEYPYDLTPSFLIGHEFFPGSILSANTGFIGSGFMNIGYIGVLINIIGVISVFKLFSIMNISSDFSGVFIVMIYTLINGFFITSILTHGLLLLIIISFVFLRNSQKNTNIEL